MKEDNKFPSNKEIWEWWHSKNFQTEQIEQEYTLIYEIDLPRILKSFIDEVYDK